MKKLLMSVVTFACVFSSVATYAHDHLKSPKEIEIHWIKSGDHSTLKIAQAIRPENFKENLDRCLDVTGNELLEQDYRFAQVYTMKLDSKPFESDASGRYTCWDGHCFYDHSVVFNTLSDCLSGVINRSTVSRISLAVQISDGIGYYPPLGDHGFQLQWDIKTNAVLINRIEFNGTDYVLIPTGHGEILSWY